MQIPTSRDINRQSTRSGRIATDAPRSGIGQALANMGQGIAEAAYNLNDLRTQEQNELNRKAGFDLETKIARFRDQEEKAFNAAREGSNESGIGFTRQFMEGYEGRVNDFIKNNFTGVTEAQDANSRQALLGLGNSLYGKSYAYEHQAKTGFYDRTTNQGLDSVRTQIRNNAAPYEELKRQGLAAIDSADMPEAWKAERRALWDADAAESKWRWKYASNPQQAINEMRGTGSNDAILASMQTVESTNRPNAESPKGASGLMQVMPQTAVGLSRDLGDANFPINGTEEEQKAYLKRPEVSRKYGEAYFNQMLNRYSGDREAALVAYNGGPTRADAWLAAGRDDSVLPKETAYYYKKVLDGAKVNTFSTQDATNAKVFLLSRTDKDATHIDGMNDGFAVKLSRLIDSAPDQIKAGLGIYSGARSNERQAELWKDALKKYGSIDEARRWVAPPGLSQHNHGNAADLAFNGQSLKNAPKEVVDWVHQNAERFGLKFPLANENWHIEDSSTRGGKAVPVDPDLDAIPYNRREQLAAWGETQYSQQVNQQRAAAKDQYALLIATEPQNVSQNVILRDTTLDNGDKATLINSLTSAMKDRGATDALIGAIASGSVSVNPFNNDQTKIADKAYERMMGAAGSAENQQVVTSDFVARTGYIPQPVQAELRRSAASTNPAELSQAMETAAVFQKNAPVSFGAFDGSSGIAKSLDLYKTYTGAMGYSAEDAARKIIAANDPEQIRRRDAILKSEPIKKVLKDTNADDVAAIFKAGFFSRSPDVGAPAEADSIKVGVNPESEAAIVADYRSVLEEALVDANGDQSAAQDIAKRRFQTIYGTTNYSPLASNIVVRYPPEKAYPAMPDGSHDYIREQLAEAMKGEGVEASAFYLQGDADTEKDIKAGKPARYQVFYEQDGKLQRYNLPFYADPDAAKAQIKEKQAQTVREAEQRMLQNRAEQQRRFPDGEGLGQVERFNNGELYRGIAREGSPMARAQREATDKRNAAAERGRRGRAQDDAEQRAWDALSPEEQRQRSQDAFLDGPGPFQKQGNR